MKVPKKMHCIWVGELEAPMKWISSWIEKHPEREYKLWTNKDLDEIDWINKKAMEVFRQKKQRAGVADCMRYEILYKYGGAMHGADSLCLNNITELFEDGFDNYVVDTSHKEGQILQEANRNSCAPLYACIPGSELAKRLIEAVGEAKVFTSAAKTVGNRLMQRVLNEKEYNIKFWPQHYFLPEHYNGYKYQGDDKIYAKHYRGTTRGTYKQGV